MSAAPAASPETHASAPTPTTRETIPENAAGGAPVRRRRLAQKLILFYVLPLSVLLLAGFLIPLALWSYFGRYVAEHRTAISLTNRVKDMAKAANNSEAAVLEYLFAPDAETLARFKDERSNVSREYTPVSEIMDTSGTPRMRDALKKAEQSFRTWYIRSNSLAKTITPANRGGPAAVAASARVRAGFAAVERDFATLEKVTQNYQEQMQSRANAAELMRTITSIVIPLTAILLTLLIGRTLALAITRPLEELTEATKELEQGRGVLMAQQAEAQGSSNDEIGDLQRAFVRMARTIGQRETMLRAQNDTLGSLNQRIAAVLNATNDGIVLLDRTGAFSVVNQRFADLFGVKAETLLDQSFTQAAPLLLSRFTDRAAVRQRLERLIADPTAAAEETLEMLEPTPRTLRVYTAPVRRDAGEGGMNELVGRIFVFRDVTRETQSDRMKNEFVSMVSHELRTPLTAIKGYVDLMVSGQTGELNEVQNEFLTMVQDSTRRLHALINDVLDISRIESGKMDIKAAKVDYVPLAEQAIKMMQQEAAKKDISLTLDVTGGATSPHPAVLGDADRITQVLVNLISNGVKYTPAGGRVSVGIEFAHDFVTTCVADTGIGLSVNEQRHLFQRFFRADNSTTRETGGTGLGLAITKAILEKSGGSIWVESEPNVGSKFWFTLPCAPDAAQTGTEAEGQYLALTVDADPQTLHRLSHELRKQGFVTTNAATAADARRRARSLRPDIILLNPLTPGLDALALLQSLHERPETQKTPVAFITPRVGPGQADLADAVTLIPRHAGYPDLGRALRTALKGAKGEHGRISVAAVGNAALVRAVREATAEIRDTIVTAADAPAEADKALGGVFPDVIVIDSQAAPGTEAGEWAARLSRQRPNERFAVILAVDPDLLPDTTQTLVPPGAGPLPLDKLGGAIKRILE